MKRKQVISDIKQAIEAAQMTRARFSLSGGMSNDVDTERIKVATYLYRDTWILEPLRAALRELEKS